MRIGRLHVLTDFHFQQQYSHAQLARMAAQGGADTVQFRQKHGQVRDKLYEARRAAAVCREHDIALTVDDHIDIALAVDAAGLHLGQTDFPVETARQIVPPDVILGATVTNLQQAKRAAAHGANYLGFGPVYTTRSKDNPASVKGLRGLKKTCSAVDLPVIAIGGITADRVQHTLEAGAHGVAVMSAVVSAPHPEAAARDIRRQIDAFFT